jgi:hypothetical protein
MGTPRRAKDVLRDFLRANPYVYDLDDEVLPTLFSFVFWLEGQDKDDVEGNKVGECRYHVLPAEMSVDWCPFDFGEGED